MKTRKNKRYQPIERGSVCFKFSFFPRIHNIYICTHRYPGKVVLDDNIYLKSIIRSSRSQMFIKIGALKNFANFTGKHLCWSLFLIKLQAFRPAKL